MFYKNFLAFLQVLKPWVIGLIIFLFIRSTGLLSGISTVTNKVLVSSGLMDAEITEPLNTDFDYEFSIQDLDGKTINFKEYKGKVIFLNMWATWCGPCRAEMASIQQLYSKVDHKNISFIMLSIDRGGVQRVKNYVSSKQFTFPVFMATTDLPEQLQVPSIPTTFIIGMDGKLISKKVGTTNFNTPEFKEYLEGLTTKKKKK
jgi:thiol-disulfide isomerase/thioredoxin